MPHQTFRKEEIVSNGHYVGRGLIKGGQTVVPPPPFIYSFEEGEGEGGREVVMHIFPPPKSLN